MKTTCIAESRGTIESDPMEAGEYRCVEIGCELRVATALEAIAAKLDNVIEALEVLAVAATETAK